MLELFLALLLSLLSPHSNNHTTNNNGTQITATSDDGGSDDGNGDNTDIGGETGHTPPKPPTRP